MNGSIDIIIPIYNEENGIEQLYTELTHVVDKLPYAFTFILINDGSSDNSRQKLFELKAHDSRIMVIDFVRNFGKEIALTAGLHASTSDAAITMDADLQHPPRYIPDFIAAWEQGNMVIVGQRTESEKRSLFRTVSTKFFYLVINVASKVKIAPEIMDFRLIDHEVVSYFNTFTERNRITRGLIDWLGYPRVFIPVQIPERVHGTSTYSTRMLMRLAKDSLVSMSLLPLKISGYLGLAIMATFGPAGIIVVSDQAFFGDNLKISGAGSLGILTAFLIGIVLFNLGLVALYIANMHDESLGRPLYVRHRNRPQRVDLSHLTSNVQKVSSKLPLKNQSGSDNANVLSANENMGAKQHKPDEPVHIASLLASRKSATLLSNVTQLPSDPHSRPQQDSSTSLSTQPNSFLPPKPQTKVLDIAESLPKKSKVLWLSWKDKSHPLAGGAELLGTEIRERLCKDGHTVTLLTSAYPGAKREEIINGVRIIRMGGRYTVHARAMLYYLIHRGQLRADLAIDEVNTAPFFFSWYSRTPTVLFFHQLAREIWFYELPRMFGAIGYALEAIYLRLLSRGMAITVSRSTRLDLLRFGFKMENISIISEGIDLQPVENVESISKFDQPTVLSLGAVRAMKRTIEQIQAFESAKSQIPNLRLIIAGDINGVYGQKVLQYIRSSVYKDDIDVLGKVSETDKAMCMQKSHFLLVTSVKEGWCLVVTETAGQGTPALAYNVDGLRDSIIDGVTGYSIAPTPVALSETIITAFENMRDTSGTQQSENPIESQDSYEVYAIKNGDASTRLSYQMMRKNAWLYARSVTFERSYADFKRSVGL